MENLKTIINFDSYKQIPINNFIIRNSYIFEVKVGELIYDVVVIGCLFSIQENGKDTAIIWANGDRLKIVNIYYDCTKILKIDMINKTIQFLIIQDCDSNPIDFRIGGEIRTVSF